MLVVAAMVSAAGVVGAAPAAAGGWSETVLDPPPARVESKVTYTFGFWVLQHGSYPIRGGDLGKVALTATDGQGASVSFPATTSATEGHYSAEVVFPHNGEWQLGTAQEMLMPDALVAVVMVPGTVRIMPSEVDQRAPHKWGPVRPSFPPKAADAQVDAPLNYLPQESAVPLVEPRAARSPADAANDTAESTPDDTVSASGAGAGAGMPVELVVAGGLMLVAVAAGVGRYVRRRND
jgi:hypothetical protein